MAHHHSNKLNTVSISSSCSEEETEDFDFQPPAIVFDADIIGQDVPHPFNAVRIPLEGVMEADLLWNEAKVAAEKYTSKGFRINWEIDLGLFGRLKRPLGDHSQFAALCLSLEHFRDTLWKQFQSQTVGVCLYRGDADFSRSYKWDEEQLGNLQEWLEEGFGSVSDLANETGINIPNMNALTVDLLQNSEVGRNLLSLFCRDAAAEYLDLLVRRLPDSMNCIVMLDSTSVNDPLLEAQLTIKERYPSVSVAVKEPQGTGWTFAWDGAREAAIISKQTSELECVEASIGICLPSVTCRKPSDYNGLKDVLSRLQSQNRPYRAVAEHYLTTEWDGLDYLVVAPQSLSAQGVRKLRGFCAAGGTVVSLGAPLRMPQEMTVEKFLASS